MKRFIIILWLMLSSAAVMQAQYIFSARVAGNSSKQTGHDLKFKIGYEIGANVEAIITPEWSIQSGLTFKTKGYKFDGLATFPQESQVYGAVEYNNALYLQVPLMANYRLRLPQYKDRGLLLGAGPYIAYGVGGRSTMRTYDIQSGEKQGTWRQNTFGSGKHRFDVGAAAQVGFEYQHYFVSFIGEWGFSNIGLPNSKNQSYSCGLGYIF